MNSFSRLLFLGGLALFVYGLRLARQGLQESSEDRLRTLIAKFTENRLSALGMGALVTGILQSSTATTVMLVGFANTGLITLRQAMGVILGADIGTSITVQFLSLHLDEWSLLFVIIGVALGFVKGNPKLTSLGHGTLGFGLVFFGMGLMSQSTVPLRDSQAFQQLLILGGNYPFWIMIGSAIFTAVVTSSAVTIGIALSLAQAGLMTLDVAVPMVLGANIGTCGTALVVGLASEHRGKQVAFSHLAFKVLGTILIWPFLPWFISFCKLSSGWMWAGQGAIVRQIANSHLIFNVGISVAFLPFIGLGARLFEKFAPEPNVGDEKKEFRARFLDQNALETPALAQGEVTREMLRVTEIIQSMFKECISLFDRFDESLVERIEADDDHVDFLDKEIRFYLAKLQQHQLTPAQSARQMHLLDIASSLEFIGDTINRDIVKLAKKIKRLNVSFSKEGLADIQYFHGKISENFDLAVSAFADRNEELARKVLRHENTLGEMESSLKQKHLARLQSGLKESFDTSSIHLELLAELKRINTLLSDLALSAIDQKAP